MNEARPEQHGIPDDVWAVVSSETRRNVIKTLQILDSDPDHDFDRLTRIAARLFDTPVALLSVVDIDRQWFKSRIGYEAPQTPVHQSLCAYAMAHRDPAHVVLDASADARFADNPLITGPEHVRFYVGAPLVVRGERLGCLCVIAPEAREAVDAGLVAQLVELADAASALFELKDEVRVRAGATVKLMKEEWRHALTLEAGKVGSWVWDVASQQIEANDIFRRMFGLGAIGPISSADMFAGMNYSDRPQVEAAFKAAFDDGADYVAEFRVASGRWLIGRGRVYQRDASGRPLVMMGVNIDITEAREAADQTRMLLRELNHRVKNTLAMIQSLARQTLRRTPEPRLFIDAFSGRLRTLSDAHALLSDSDWSGIGLMNLIDSQVRPYLMNLPEQLILEGEDLRLPPDHSLGLGLILHELASNAVKYGALSVPSGVVRISWRQEGEPGRINLIWKEMNGPMVSAPAELGFGSKLIERSLDKVLESSVQLKFSEDGVEAIISFPLD